MLTKEQHIEHWINTAQYDWTGVEHAFGTKNYLHCLFWAHLVLEKDVYSFSIIYSLSRLHK